MISAQHLDPMYSLPWLRSYLLALVSQIAYLEESDRRRSLAAIGFEEQLFAHGKGLPPALADTEMMVITNAELLIIAFRGSETTLNPLRNIIDWLNDLTILKKKYKSTRVHSGFVNALEAVWPVIAYSIDQWGDHRQVWLTGHSLGGAIAQLAGYSLDHTGIDVKGVVTFGSPRVGGGIWKKSLEETELWHKFELWVNNQDPIVRLPPTTGSTFRWFERFPLWTHIGLLHFIDQGQKKVCLNYKRSEDIVWPTIRVEDHAIENYIARIKAFMPGTIYALFQWLLSSQTSIQLRALLNYLPTPIVDPVSLRILIAETYRKEGANKILSLQSLMAKKAE